MGPKGSQIMCIIDPLKGTKLELHIISNANPSRRMKGNELELD